VRADGGAKEKERNQKELWRKRRPLLWYGATGRRGWEHGPESKERPFITERDITRDSSRHRAVSQAATRVALDSPRSLPSCATSRRPSARADPAIADCRSICELSDARANRNCRVKVTFYPKQASSWRI